MTCNICGSLAHEPSMICPGDVTEDLEPASELQRIGNILDLKMAECFAGDYPGRKHDLGVVMATLAVLREVAVSVAGPEADKALVPHRLEKLANAIDDL